MARESARMVPVRMPGSAAGSTCARTVCQRVAPSARPPSRIELGTARSASRDATMMIGSTSRLSVSAAAMIDRPMPKKRTNAARPRMP